MRGGNRKPFVRRRHGPRLPDKLVAELGGAGPTSGDKRTHGGRGNARGGHSNPLSSGKRERNVFQREGPSAGSNSWKDSLRPTKRQRGALNHTNSKRPPGQMFTSSKTKFFELLNQEWEQQPTQEAYEREVQLQRGLEKKLGMKKTRAKTGPEDGLDDLLVEVGGLGSAKGIKQSVEGVNRSKDANKKQGADIGLASKYDDLNFLMKESSEEGSDFGEEDDAGLEEDGDGGGNGAQSEGDVNGSELEEDGDYLGIGSKKPVGYGAEAEDFASDKNEEDAEEDEGDEDDTDDEEEDFATRSGNGKHVETKVHRKSSFKMPGNTSLKKRNNEGLRQNGDVPSQTSPRKMARHQESAEKSAGGSEEQDEGESEGVSGEDGLGESELDDEDADERDKGGEGEDDSSGGSNKDKQDGRLGNAGRGHSDEEGSKEDRGGGLDRARGKQNKEGKAASGGAYIPPALRAAAGVSGASQQLERRVKGLLNRLAEANLAGIVRDVTQLYQESGRRTVSELVADILLEAVAEGPRASRQFAAVAASFVAGLAAQADAQEIGASFLSKLASRLEAACLQQDSLSQGNLVMVVAYLYSCGLLTPDLMYSLLDHLTQRFQESDVSLMVTLLSACGPQLRASMPEAMKAFVLAVHTRAGQASKAGGLTKRSELLLELVVDIKNNRKAKQASGAAAVLSSPVLKWLKSTGVADVALTGLTWSKLLTPSKKGMWWLPAAGEALTASASQYELGAGGALDRALQGTEPLLALASAQRMNTELRRALFCAIMGSEDVLEAFERLTSMRIKGEQQREVVRVVVQCCLAERTWNPYYALLASKLAGASKAHTTTLQYTLWDQWKTLSDLDARQLSHLARLAAHLVAKGALSLTVIKVVEFGEALKGKPLFHWRVFFRDLLLGYTDTGILQASFLRFASRPELAQSAVGLLVFLRTGFGPWVSDPSQSSILQLSSERVDSLLKRLRVAEKSLKAVGAL